MIIVAIKAIPFPSLCSCPSRTEVWVSDGRCLVQDPAADGQWTTVHSLTTAECSLAIKKATTLQGAKGTQEWRAAWVAAMNPDE